jgi:hypothetical protein
MMPRPNAITRTTDVLTFLEFIAQRPDIDRPECKKAYDALRRYIADIASSNTASLRIGLFAELSTDATAERAARIRAFVDGWRDKPVTERLCSKLLKLLSGHTMHRVATRRSTRYVFKKGVAEKFTLTEGRSISLEKLYDIAAARFTVGRSSVKRICLYR